MADLVAVQADITTIAVDAVVNAANSELAGGGGVDGAIHRAGGPAIYESMATYRARGGCRTGEALIGTGGNLPARHVIHTVGPIWTGDDPHRHDALLASCYRSALDLADEHQLATVAFPNISTGVYGFPKERAAGVAVGAVRAWLDEHPQTTLERVTFVCFDAENLGLYVELVD